MKTAILIDGGFFIKRAKIIFDKSDPLVLSKIIHSYCRKHLNSDQKNKRELYRIFFYDCPPLSKKMKHPISGKTIDFSRTPEYKWRVDLHNELRKTRKLALRLGHLDETNTAWTIRPRAMKDLFSGKIKFTDLKDSDVIINTKQKGVDMRIGVDISSLAFKKQVDQIILIAGDSDFVPAAKLARREGIDFILDPMWNPIKADLFEHIDGLSSACRNPAKARNDLVIDTTPNRKKD